MLLRHAVPKAKKSKSQDQAELAMEAPGGITVDGQTYDPRSIINEVRSAVDTWRKIPDAKNWGVTPETARLLQHWRHHEFNGLRPFFCQVEAVETAIWLTEVAPKQPQYKKFQKYLEAANNEANPALFRIALKLATGAGKTTVMSMIIAWQTVNAARYPSSKLFSKGFLVVAPGITIKDRLNVLLPNDVESYYKSREILPADTLPEIGKAKIVITNYHAFQLREKITISAGGKALLKGRSGNDLLTRETEGQMVQRVLGDLMGMKNIVVLNDEAHHCYREKTGPTAEDSEEELTGDEKKEAKKQNEYARLWINGIEAVKRVLGVRFVFDLSATPFFLAGSGYREGTLFPWVMSDFSLMDAIECGIVKLPRVPISELVYKYISGFEFPEKKDGTIPPPHLGQFALFRNYDENGSRLPQPRSLLIDSEQLESGDALDPAFRKMFEPEIERFRRDLVQRTQNTEAGKNISDSDLLREVMNSVGQPGKLGGEIRCVVSVSMLTEGWDANTVTHILGVRAFGTQLLCEQVVGRGLRRENYELNEEGLFDVEYADILGIPFDFTAKPVIAQPKPPKPTVRVHAVREREHLEMTFPRVQGYRTEQTGKRLLATFSDDHTFVLNPTVVGPSKTVISGIVGKTEELNVEHLRSERESTILFKLTTRLIETHYRDENGELQLHLFGQLKRIVRQWLDNHLTCQGDCYPAQILMREMADKACGKIQSAILLGSQEEQHIIAILDPYNPTGSTSAVAFNSSKPTWTTDPEKSHVNLVVTDSEWEAEFARVAEAHPAVLSYVKNQGLGLEVPYLKGASSHRYLPDFLLKINDGHGEENPLNLIVEIKGFRDEDAQQKALTMHTYWIPGINHLATHGRWAFLEITQPFSMESDLSDHINAALDQIPTV